MTVRVHESWNEGDGQRIIAFNLDDMDQFERYVNAVAARPAGWPDRLVIHLTERDGDHTHHHRQIRTAKGNDLIVTLVASNPEAHSQCEACRLFFDRSAGNGTARTEQRAWNTP